MLTRCIVPLASLVSGHTGHPRLAKDRLVENNSVTSVRVALKGGSETNWNRRISLKACAQSLGEKNHKRLSDNPNDQKASKRWQAVYPNGPWLRLHENSRTAGEAVPGSNGALRHWKYFSFYSEIVENPFTRREPLLFMSERVSVTSLGLRPIL